MLNKDKAYTVYSMNNDLLRNAPLIAAAISFAGAQFFKPFINLLVEKKFDPKLFFSTGGMPSSHTAGVIALVTAVGLKQGVGTIEFAISTTFASIVIHDAMGIRRAAGKQAEVINKWSELLEEIHKDGRFTEKHLKTMLGHSFSQVAGGILFGFLVSILVVTFDM